MIDSVTKLPVSEKWEKMSKSKHNGVNPSVSPLASVCRPDLTYPFSGYLGGLWGRYDSFAGYERLTTSRASELGPVW